jgi:hypothetical protein
VEEEVGAEALDGDGVAEVEVEEEVVVVGVDGDGEEGEGVVFGGNGDVEANQDMVQVREGGEACLTHTKWKTIL